MQKLKGRLQYGGWFNYPWKLVTKNGDIDLWPIIDKFLISLNGKRAEHNRECNGYILAADENSEFQFKYIPDEYVLLEKVDGFGGSNVHFYLEQALVFLSGRMVEIEIEEGKEIKLMADKAEKVYGVYFVDDGNCCKVPKGDEKTICKVGQPDCCIFVSIGGDGCYCEKFNGPLARELLDRLAKGKTSATRIGSCELLGRKARKTVTA